MLVAFGLLILRATTLLAPFVIFLALPPFYAGIWDQVDGAVPWLHALGAFGAAGTGLLTVAGDERARSALVHPLVTIPGAIFAVAVVLLPFTTIPALSLFGAPEQGFGALAYLDLAALTAAALVVLVDAKWRRIVAVATFSAIAVAFILDGLFRKAGTWAPFYFGDYLAFYAVAAFAMLGVLTSGRKVIFALCAASCFGLVLLSSNKAAVLAIGGALVLLPLIWRAPSRRTALVLGSGLPIAVGFAIILVGSAWSESRHDVLVTLNGFGPLPRLLADSWASLWSRAMLTIVGFQALFDTPWRFLTGMGWGHYNEALLANLPTAGGRLHEFIGTSHIYWDAVLRNDFHSHNQYFEGLLSGGVVSGALLLLYGAAIAASAPPAHRRLALFVVAILATLQSFWFQMPHTLPVMAIAMAFLTIGGTGGPEIERRGGIWIGPALTAAILVTAAGSSLVAAGNAGRIRQAITADIVWGDEQPVERRFAAGLSEVRDAEFIQQSYILLTGRHERSGTASEQGLAILDRYLSAAMQGDGPQSLKLSISVINALSGIQFVLPEYEGRLASRTALLGQTLEAFLRRAPRRSDVAVPYLNYLLGQGREADILNLANLIMARRPADPVGLWFSGIVLLGNPVTSRAGMGNLRQSLAQGIRDIMPVDEALIRSIEQ